MLQKAGRDITELRPNPLRELQDRRRMDPDVIYERTVKSLLDGDRSSGNKSRARKASSKI